MLRPPGDRPPTVTLPRHETRFDKLRPLLLEQQALRPRSDRDLPDVGPVAVDPHPEGIDAERQGPRHAEDFLAKGVDRTV